MSDQLSINSRIFFRIAENRDQLTSLNNRIFTAQAKIDKLRSVSTKATLVFSSPKYPAPDRISDYHSIYEEVDSALNKVCYDRSLYQKELQLSTHNSPKGGMTCCLVIVRE